MFNSIFINCMIHKHILHLCKCSVVRNFSKLTYYNSAPHVLLKNPIFHNNLNYKQCHINALASHKQHVLSENGYAYKIMQSLPQYKKTLSFRNQSIANNIKKEDFDNELAKHWRSESATNIGKTFEHLCHYAKMHKIPISNTCFNNLVDGLMDKCQDLTDDELSDLLVHLREYPATESMTSHNFHDIWSALDDMCCARISSWSIQKILLIADHWHLLGMSKYCDYTKQAIKMLSRRTGQLTSTELVQTLFYLNVCRKSWSMFDFECQLEKCIQDLTTDELAIVSMGFFKTKSVIKGTFLLGRMLEKVREETSTINEITLSAILKITRYSPHIPLVDQINELLTRLVPEVDRLSFVCCIHIALAGTNSQLFHPEVLREISNKFVKDISEARLKDLERLTFALTLYNFNPKTIPDIFDTVLSELRKPERQDEITKYPRCLASCVHYLGLQQIYPKDLLNKVLDPQFINDTYGDNKRNIGREIIFMDTSIDIDCPEYKGYRINDKLQSNLTKWGLDWIPRRDQKQRLTSADKLTLDVKEALEVIHGKNEYIHIDYILPHFQKPDIIICKDKQGKPIKVNEHFEKYQIGDIMKPHTKAGLIWYAVVIGSWNMNIRYTNIPVGTLDTKLRQLKLIGYQPILVFWGEFMQLSKKEKEDYLRNKIL